MDIAGVVDSYVPALSNRMRQLAEERHLSRGHQLRKAAEAFHTACCYRQMSPPRIQAHQMAEAWRRAYQTYRECGGQDF